MHKTQTFWFVVHKSSDAKSKPHTVSFKLVVIEVGRPTIVASEAPHQLLCFPSLKTWRLLELPYLCQCLHKHKRRYSCSCAFSWVDVTRQRHWVGQNHLPSWNLNAELRRGKLKQSPLGNVLSMPIVQRCSNTKPQMAAGCAQAVL